MPARYRTPTTATDTAMSTANTASIGGRVSRSKTRATSAPRSAAASGASAGSAMNRTIIAQLRPPDLESGDHKVPIEGDGGRAVLRPHDGKAGRVSVGNLLIREFR